MKRVAFKTVGCRLNQAETAEMAAAFSARGYQVVAYGDACDVCVVHGCAVTRKAELDSLRLTRQARAGAGRPLTVLAGCAVEAGDRRLLARAGAHLLVPQQQKYALPEQVEQWLEPTGRRCSSPPAANPPLLPLFTTTRALLKVQDGCGFRCSYCIVPLARGNPRGRPLAEVLAQAQALAAAGYREIVVTGANLGCYADGTRRLPDLLRALHSVRGIERIRLSSIESTTAAREVIAEMTRSSKLCHYLHLPLQSGDDDILRAMRRRYTFDEYRRLVEYAVAALPRLGLGTDLLVGFPGESDAAFDRTVQAVESLPFSNLHVFAYSPRPGTPAADLPNRVPEKMKKERVRRLLALGRRKRDRFAERFVALPVEVLVESASGNRRRMAAGWTRERVKARIRIAGRPLNRIVSFTPARASEGILYAE